MTSLRAETAAGVRHLVLCRPEAYNTITPELRDELAAAIDDADADPGVRVILLRAEGRAFCAGYGLDWATAAESRQRVYDHASRDDQAPPETESPPPPEAQSPPPPGANPASAGAAGARSEPQASEVHPTGARSEPQASEAQRVWDSVADYRMMSRFVDTYLKLWYARKPTIAAVQGWCIGGGTDMVLCADQILAADDAVFGYPPSRVWGTPTTAMWVYRMGVERAKRYLLTGDEIPARTAAEIGLILEVVPAAELESRARAFAERMARLPLNQLVMLKLLCNQTVENMGFASSRTLGTLFDGIARHTQEGLDFVRRAEEVGYRQAVRERDDPFEDYGSRKRR